MLTGDTASAASAAGVARNTLYRWLKEPDFERALRDAEAVAMDELSRELVRLARSAVGTLATAMSDREGPAGTRVRAADITLSRLLQVRELATLEGRIAALEAVAGIEAKP
jgi:transposase-like protein